MSWPTEKNALVKRNTLYYYTDIKVIKVNQTD